MIEVVVRSAWVFAVLVLASCEQRLEKKTTPPRTTTQTPPELEALGAVPDGEGNNDVGALDLPTTLASSRSKRGRFTPLIAPGGTDGYPNFLWVVDTETGAVHGYRFANRSKGSGWLVEELDGPY